jgi:glycerol uptake facilitator-like aquaporin
MWIPRFSTIPDRVTWAVLIWIFFNLLWLKFVESYVPQWVGAFIAAILVVALAVFSPGPKEEVEEEETVENVEAEEGK